MTLGDGLGVVQGAVLLVALLPRLRLFPVEALFAQDVTVAGAGSLRTLYEIPLTLAAFEAGGVKAAEARGDLLWLKHLGAAALAPAGVTLGRGELGHIHGASGPRARPVTVEDSVAGPAEHGLVGAVSEAAGVQGPGAVGAGETGRVDKARPGDDPLRLEGHGPALEAALGALHRPPLVSIQVEILGNKVSLDKAGFAKYLICFVTKHRVVTQPVTALEFVIY